MRRLASIVLVAALATGCTLGPDYARPQTPQHPAYSSIADLPWWEIFSDPTLDELIRTALDNNRNLRASLARIEEARARLGVTRADLYPSIVYGANASYEDATRGDNSTSAAAFADVSYIVDLWGRVRRSNEASLRDLLATEEAYGVVTITLVADVASAYFQLRGIDKRLDISERHRPGPLRGGHGVGGGRSPGAHPARRRPGQRRDLQTAAGTDRERHQPAPGTTSHVDFARTPPR